MNGLFFLGIILIIPAHAYLDPGTGSMLVSTLIALIATLIYSLKGFSFKVKSFISRLWGGKIEKIENSDIVIYNEGNQYFTTFYPIIRELTKREIKFTYLYSEKEDPILQKIDTVDAHFIDRGNKAFFYLNTLSARICIMTTPGLDVLQIKRSKSVTHYCHIAHSTGGCRYEVFGVDYYDSVLVPNMYDKNFIEGLEKKRNLPEKDIRVIGTPYLDYTLEQISILDVKKENKTTILVSPTWGEHGLLNMYGEEILDVLLPQESYNVIVRPHPQSIEYESDMIESLRDKFANKKNLHWDYENDGLTSMSKASIMISDFSGIILDYMFLYSRPVISLPGTIDLRGKDYIDKDKTLWQIDFYNKHTTVLDKEHIINLGQIISNVLQEGYGPDKNIYEEYNPYMGNSAIQAVNAIEEINENIKNGEK
jgi:CDP-glycerol glycerophosphotransferase (TagB/SpsB family)